jgi:hypothetical protein
VIAEKPDEVAGLFSAWPFTVVPDPSASIIWAGRPTLKAQIDQYLGALNLRPQSSVDVIWAAFGSGKTHFLLYLAQEAQRQGKTVAWYCVTPKAARNLADFYQAIGKSIPVDRITQAISVVDQRGELDGDFRSVFRALYMGSTDQKGVAAGWMKGQPTNLRTARALVDIPFKLDGAQEILNLLSAIARVISKSGARFLLLLDEYQRIRTIKSALRETVSAAFLDLFNSVPRGVSLLFSCSAMQQTVAFEAIPADLHDRMRGRRPFAIPAMGADEAHEFATDLIRLQRPEGYSGGTLAPFSERSLDLAIARLSAAAGGHLTPRRLMQVLDNALTRVLLSRRSVVEEKDIEDAVLEVEQGGEEGD